MAGEAISADGITDPLETLRSIFCSKPYEVSKGVYVRCQSRRSSACPSCAELYRGDWARVARSGIYDSDGQPVLGFRYFFLTMSAPSFGRIHRVPKSSAERRRCHCGKAHSPEDVHLRGLPVDLDAYDYAGQVAWHVGLGRLWNASVSAMRDLVPDLEYCAVREVQARMALHMHIIVRVPSTSLTTAKALGAVARRATAAHPVTGKQVAWGQRGVQDREIKSRHVDAPGTMPSDSAAAARVVRYVSKALNYSLKDINPGDSADPPPERFAFVQRLRKAARFDVRCTKCSGRPGDCAGKAHSSIGYAGHTISISRPTTERPGWSFSGLTRASLREQRRVWMEANASEHVGAGLGDLALFAASWIREELTVRAYDAACSQPARAPSRR
ncbi:replication initiator [Microbacterium phosphatis]|uniref:replication initiator n=1 Tax=Microbacterium phosphatis TaxID=3140248 RepID=UPI0031408366